MNGVLKDGKAKSKIESEEGKRIFQYTFPVVSLPYNGDIPIAIKSIEDDELYSLNFMDVFTQLGFNSFLTDDNFNKWRKAFQLKKGRA